MARSLKDFELMGLRGNGSDGMHAKSNHSTIPILGPGGSFCLSRCGNLSNLRNFCSTVYSYSPLE